MDHFKKPEMSLKDELNDYIWNSDDSDESSDEEDVIFTENEIFSEIPLCKPILSIDELRQQLSPDEFDVIDKCHDGALRTELIANRSTYLYLEKLENKLTRSLVNVKNEMAHAEFKPLTQARFNRASYPYFKDSAGFTSTPNADTIRKRELNVMQFSYMTVRHRWTKKAQSQLRGAVRLRNLNHYKETVEKRIADVRNSNQNAHDIAKQISSLEKVLENNKENYDKLPLLPPGTDADYIDWTVVSIVNLHSRHSPATAKAMWNNYLHPDLNTDRWTPREDVILEEMVDRYRAQDWDSIAKELNTGRSPFLTCMHYYSQVANRSAKFKKAFTPEEDDMLLALVQECAHDNGHRRQIPWAKIAYHFPGRSRLQVYTRYTTYLQYSGRKYIRPFTEIDDIKILYFVRKYGKDWKRIADNLQRALYQVRSRYQNQLRLGSENTQGNWTLEDDKLIAQAMNNDPMHYLRTLIPLFKRGRSSVRYRCKLVANSLQEGMPLDQLPRRQHSQAFKSRVSRLNMLVDKYLNDDTGKYDWLELKSPDVPATAQLSAAGKPLGRPNAVLDIVDSQLIDYFKPFTKVGRAFNKEVFTAEYLQRCAQSVLNVTDVLGVTIDPVSLLAEHNDSLDEIDKDLLSAISTMSNSKQPCAMTCSQQDQINLFAPNPSNCSALRALMNSTYQKKCKPTKTSVADEQQALYSKHFLQLFRWPAILSTHTVQDTLPRAGHPVVNPAAIKRLAPKPRGRPPKYDRSKIALMNAARGAKRKRDDDNSVAAVAEGTSCEGVTSIAVATPSAQLQSVDETVDDILKLEAMARTELGGKFTLDNYKDETYSDSNDEDDSDS